MDEKINYQVSVEKFYHWIESNPKLSGESTRRVYTKEHIPILLRIECTISTENPTQTLTVLKSQAVEL